MSSRRVCVVFDPMFGARLSSLDFGNPIWIVQSAENDPAISEFWQAKTGNITSFQPQPFGQLVDTVDQHHPGWSEMEVHGLALDDAKLALAEYGNGTYDIASNGFVFRRDIR